ncbi:adenosylmethionine-8-amino-7-oxononanoate aminotransferase [Aspergillus lucknowensis]|uniref:Adenosylmethionine-8-amino-7-oxononanoate aminotransferase n=1 Tax=Aspergillus lucknowensis TaxID=176173 RepID=A0ABR4LNM6_9EURO
MSQEPHPEPHPEPSLLHRSLLQLPHTVTHAKGSYLHLSTGRAILDGCGGAAVAILGHGHPDVLTATAAQMHQVSYVHTLSYTTSAAEDLARAVLDRENCPSYAHGLVRAFFVGSGSEANDAAMKLARQYHFELGHGHTTRKVYVSRRGGYHGNTIGAMSISGNVARKKPYLDTVLGNVSLVSPAFAYRFQRVDEGESEEMYAARLVREVEEEFVRVGPENVVMFSGETVVGATTGCVAAPRGYWRGIRELCSRYGILLHLDEVMCGAGRTGSYFAFEREGICPDIVTLGKGLGGGYIPVAAMLVSGGVVDVLRRGSSVFNHGHTYQAHPVACAAALAVQRVLRRERLVERCAVQGGKLEGLLREAFGGSRYVGDIRGRGLFWALEFVRDRKSKEPFDPEIGFGAAVQEKAFELGVAVYPGAGTVDGERGDHVILAPPYNVTDEELGMLVETLKRAYDAVEQQVRSKSQT